uniref:von Willebrand factor A domain-containing protein 7-like n=1 Tax=Gouania willdenowi TaxID=441366 RepID=A0A8C5H930_GOUWI
MNPMQVVTVLVIISLPDLTKSFQPDYNILSDGVSFTHLMITETAILRKTAEVCRDIAADEGRDFTLNIDGSLTVSKVQRACSGTPSSTVPVSAVSFQNALSTIHDSNTRVDTKIKSALTAENHFDNEEFVAGRNIITEGVFAVKFNVLRGNFEVGRKTLGRICHTLQDFYSHSDWVELNNNKPYSALIIPSQPLTNLAGQDVPTCSSCTEDVCRDNILPNILERKLLTSGYFELFSKVKPAGKCSHGGAFDRTSREDPEGGINKDSVGSFHGYLHVNAATVAIDATIELLEDIRTAVGDKTFLQFMGVSQSSALSFVIDTTGSMADDIAAVKETSFSIIDSRRGTAEEPSVYILVPFHDPEFGPVIRTTDPDTFKAHINELTAKGGSGGLPEYSMSGLQLALTAAPPSSDIFLFTDAPAEDAHLKNTVLALIESTKSRVTFMLTDVVRGRDSQSSSDRFASSEGTLIYRDLARASGGQTIEVSKLNLIEGTAVIEDLSANAVVTVFQVTEDPGKPENFTFIVDAATSNIKIFVTGISSLTFQLTSPSGVSQKSSEPSGPLASITTVGNLRRILVNGTNETGTWELSVSSSSAYSVKVTGQSSVNFLYNIVEKREGAHAGIDVQEGRPSSGGNVTLLVTVTGSDTAKVTHVSLYDSSGPTQINGTVQALDNNNFLAEFTEIPAGDYVVRLIGQESNPTSRSTPTMFQRQASTRIKTSSLTVTSLVATSILEPGSNISIPFTVSSNVNGTFMLQVNNDRSFDVAFPSSVSIGGVDGGTANGTGTLTVPADVNSGTDLTVTIQAQNTAGTEINFAVVRFSVVARVADMSGPVCEVVNISGICPHSIALCASSQWELTANLTDGVNGTGIERITLREGNGTFNTVTVTEAGGVNVTMLTYNSSCCSQRVVLATVDRAGNVGRCVGQARMLSTPTPMTVTNSTLNFTTAASTTSHGTLQVADMSGPVCEVVNISGICPHSFALCASSHWELTANLTDGVNGTGIERITLREGNGTFNTDTVTDAGGVNVTMLTYNSSCCSQRVVLAAVDRAGNVGRCVGQARVLSTPTPMTVTNSTLNITTAASTMSHGTLQVADMSGPVCEVVNISGICPHSFALCASSQWELTANLTDGVNGTGIERITLREGNGTFNTVTVTEAGGVNVTMLTYNSSCCSQRVVLAAVDRAGNVGRCVGQARVLSTPTPMTVTNSTLNITTAASTTSHSRLSHGLLILGLIFLLLK